MESVGRYLRTERELRKISLEEIAQSTRIPLRSLQWIEEDRFDRLPGEVFVRGFLRAYAKALGLTSDEVIRRYESMAASSNKPPESTSMQRLTVDPSPSSRFGLALAVVLLMVLFTLAISVVMRPRQRGTSIELSVWTNPLSLPLAPPV
ncbi:MAG: helix-turn-helix domain-containing protein [Sandaracinaceae bacterium]|nr:helix-turn-helix domain-containing protein [Sandaracinaceae bacterium]MDW8247107.1 helix-turn-helix domain-containing protein [Sandaracinaceae bacterium]